jgi:hypothetical protein
MEPPWEAAMTAPVFSNYRHSQKTDAKFGRMVGVLILLMLFWLIFVGNKSSSNVIVGLNNPPVLGMTSTPSVIEPAPLQILDDGPQ